MKDDRPLWDQQSHLRSRFVLGLKGLAICALAFYGVWCVAGDGALVLERLFSRSFLAERYVTGCAADVAGWRYLLWASAAGVYLWLEEAVPTHVIQIMGWIWVGLSLVGGLLLFAFGVAAACG
jgi:hypothetical protein